MPLYPQIWPFSIFFFCVLEIDRRPWKGNILFWTFRWNIAQRSVTNRRTGGRTDRPTEKNALFTRSVADRQTDTGRHTDWRTDIQASPSSNGIMDYSYIMFSGHTFPSGVTAMLVRCISTGDTGSCLCCNFAQAASCFFFQQVYSVFLTVLLMFPLHWRGGSVINPRHTYCSTSVNKADSQASQHIGLESSWLCTVICVSLLRYTHFTMANSHSHRAPKQWSLTKSETISSFEAWRQNLHYTLSLDPNFAPFLAPECSWLKSSKTAPKRGLTDDPSTDSDGADIPAGQRRTAAQKAAHLELMLGQIANFCPIIARNTIVKNSASIDSIWQAIRLHFGFQTTGAHFLDFCQIKLQPGDRYEDLFQQLMAFTDDNLLKKNGGITHHRLIP